MTEPAFVQPSLLIGQGVDNSCTAELLPSITFKTKRRLLRLLTSLAKQLLSTFIMKAHCGVVGAKTIILTRTERLAPALCSGSATLPRSPLQQHPLPRPQRHSTQPPPPGAMASWRLPVLAALIAMLGVVTTSAQSSSPAPAAVTSAKSPADEANTTAAEETTTSPHLCVASNPCGENSQCVEVGDKHICTCKKGFSGVGSADGDGCHRTRITSAADAKGRQGLHVAVGEGADLHVRAGGELRGRVASVLQMAADLEALLGDVQTNAAAIADNTAALGALDANVGTLRDTLTASIRAVNDNVQVAINEHLTPAIASIAANSKAIDEERKRAMVAERANAAASEQGVAGEKDRAETVEAALKESAFAEAARAQVEEGKIRQELREKVCAISGSSEEEKQRVGLSEDGLKVAHERPARL